MNVPATVPGSGIAGSSTLSGSVVGVAPATLAVYVGRPVYFSEPRSSKGMRRPAGAVVTASEAGPVPLMRPLPLRVALVSAEPASVRSGTTNGNFVSSASVGSATFTAKGETSQPRKTFSSGVRGSQSRDLLESAPPVHQTPVQLRL